MSKSVQGKAKQLIREMYLAPTRKAALAAYDQLISTFRSKFSKACECLEKDQEFVLTFCDFPARHWPRLRTNPIESAFASVMSLNYVEITSELANASLARRIFSRILTHLSLLAGSATRESAPELNRDQKVCTTAGMF
jgi:transposase-like protein